MRRSLNTTRALAWALLATSGSACSLVNLSGDIEQAQCASQDDCDVLNDHAAADFDPCVIWQCAETLYCERSALDLDHDGFSPRTAEHEGEDLVCEADSSRVDCDDGTRGSNPERDETCDAADNDCDEQVDEGVLDTDDTIVSVFADENSEGIGEATYAIDSDSGTVAVAYGLRRGASSVPGMNTVDSTLATGSSVGPLTLPAGDPRILLADSVGVGALGGDRFAVAFVNDSGARRVIAGIAKPRGDGFELAASDDVLRLGLRCAAREDCASNAAAGPTDTLVAAPVTVTPAVVARGDDVLVVYARAAEGEGACADAAAAPSAVPVLANALSYNPSAGTLSERDGAALVIGQTLDRTIPAVLALPELGGELDLGFLVAIANADGAVELVRVSLAGGVLMRSDPLLVLEGDGARLSDVALALGGGDASARQLGVVMQRGCGASARVVFELLELSVDDGALSAAHEAGPINVGGNPNETRPSVAWSEARDGWLVAYRDGSGLRARALTSSGTLLGTDSYVLLEEVEDGDDALRIAASPFAVPLGGAAWFGTLAAIERAEDYVLQTVTLSSCP